MSSVDDRIVNMQFNNKQFTAGASESQRSLEGLDRTIANTAKGEGLNTLANGVDQVKGRFGAMQVAGVAAVATIASKATSAGLNILKSFTLDPLTQGFQEYQTNLNSIQVIMANTGAKVGEVNKYLNDLNHYSDQTIYNFGQMASAIGKFTAAGVKLPDATSAIKGMANAAALSGADANQLNSAMYQMSQALAAGTIHLMDWNSLVNANMGGQNIQNALKATAMSMDDGGKAMLDATQKAGNFRDSLQSGWLSADIFNKTMKVMAGTTNNAGKTVAFTVDQLKGMGYSEDAAKQLHTLSSASIDAATKIKTLPQLLDVVKESIGSGWSKIFQDLFGNFTESTKMWTSVGASITGTVSSIFGSVDKMLVGWRKLGGYQDLWTGFGNIFKILGNLIHPFVAAFQALLPSTGKAGSALAGLTHGFATFTGFLVKVSAGANLLTPILVKMAEGIKFVFSTIGQLIHVGAQLLPLFQQMAEQGAGIAQGLIGGIVDGLNLGAIENAIVNFANGIVDTIKNALGIHSPAATMIPVGFNIVVGIAQGIIHGIAVIAPALAKVIKVIWDHVTGLFKGFDAMDWAALFNAILSGGMILAFKKAADAFASFGDMLGSTKRVIDGVGDSLKAWQQSLKAKMILEIAIAVGILAASIIALSLLDPKKLAIGLGAISTIMGTLAGTLLALSKIDSDKQMAVLATSMVLISGAMIGFATAVTILGQQDPKSVAQGVGVMAAVLGILVGTMLAFSKISGSIAGMAGSMLIMATAMNILAAAVLAFGNMQLDTLAKGLGAIAIGLGLMVGALMVLSLSKGSIEGAAGSILIMSTAMVILSAAVLAFGNMDMQTLAKGFGAVAVGLGLMVGSLLLLSGNTAGVVAGAGAILMMSAAMVILAGAVGTFGSMDLMTLAKGFGAIAVGLGLFLLAGAVAMEVGPGLEILGSSMLMLGAAMFLAGTGMAAFGTGFALLAATGAAGTAVLIATIHALLAILPEIATQAAASFIAFLKVIANASAELRPILGKIIGTIIGTITDNIPKIVHLAVVLVSELLKGIEDLIPKFAHLVGVLITAGLGVLTKAIPQFVNAGMKIILGVLNGLDNGLPKIIDRGVAIIVHLIEGIGKGAVKIADTMGRTVLKVLQGLDDAVQRYSDPIAREGRSIVGHLIEGIISGLGASDALNQIKDALGNLAHNAVDAAKHAFGINSPARTMVPIGRGVTEGVAKGIVDSTRDVIRAVVKMANAIIAAGDAQVLKAQKAARGMQERAYAAQARADLRADRARDAARYAKQHKKDKQAQKRAKELQKEADKANKKAAAIQKQADKAAQHVQDVQTFQQADLHGKGDIRNEAAVALADRADQVMAKANAEAERARELMKTNRKAARAMLEQAKKDAKRARELAAQARKAHKDANKYYAQEVDDRIKQLEADAAADEQAKKDQAAYDAADAQGKSDILTKRAEADEAKAAALKQQSLDLIAQAKKLANTDAKKAMELLDQAQQAADDAQAAADQAAQERDQAQQVLNEGSSGGSGGTPSIQPSRSILEDAASVVDRYTASLQEAMTLAAATQSPVQFVQNNYSPESLSASEIYRQSKNLLSTAEVKMGATTP